MKMGSSYHKEAMENAGAGFNSGKVRAITRSESAVVPEETIQMSGENHDYRNAHPQSAGECSPVSNQ